MKKIILVIILLLTVGCTNINDYSFENIVAQIGTKSNRANVFRTGYKYYLPTKMQVSEKLLFNEVLDDGDTLYYLYIDAVSYYNKEKIKYDLDAKSFYSKSIVNGDKTGYVQIKIVENDKYLVEIMYNYAKIEVIVDKENLSVSMLSAINILKSIEYNDSIIANILGDNILSFKEEKFSIFETHSDDDGYIQVIDDFDDEVEDEIPDTDLIN